MDICTEININGNNLGIWELLESVQSQLQRGIRLSVRNHGSLLRVDKSGQEVLICLNPLSKSFLGVEISKTLNGSINGKYWRHIWAIVSDVSWKSSVKVVPFASYWLSPYLKIEELTLGVFSSHLCIETHAVITNLQRAL